MWFTLNLQKGGQTLCACTHVSRSTNTHTHTAATPKLFPFVVSNVFVGKLPSPGPNNLLLRDLCDHSVHVLVQCHYELLTCVVSWRNVRWTGEEGGHSFSVRQTWVWQIWQKHKEESRLSFNINCCDWLHSYNSCLKESIWCFLSFI